MATKAINEMNETELQEKAAWAVKAICECWPALLKEHPVRHMVIPFLLIEERGLTHDARVCLDLVREYDEVGIERIREWEHDYDEDGGHTVTTSFYNACAISGKGNTSGFGSGPTINVGIVRAWLDLVLPAIEKAGVDVCSSLGLSEGGDGDE